MILGDCMDYMAGLPDKAFELAIVDPPYGINISNNMGKRRGDKKSIYAPIVWDSSIPDEKYFDELYRVSENQIIWGGNYFPLDPTSCWILWDKGFSPDVTFAQFEMAWTSFNSSCKKYDKSPVQLNRIHPTQKPVALYKWLLSRYTHPGDRILDTHGGSFSNVIACLDLGYPIVCIEKDEDYFEASLARVREFALQPRLIDDKPAAPIPQNLFQEAAK
jgi:site-specific DNA-methyltransferase (adenine-specific)